MNKEIYIERRKGLNAILENDTMILLFAAADDSIYFQQNKNFQYFSGLEIPEAIMLLVKRDGKISTALFLERTIPERIVWDGAKMDKKTATGISGIEKIFWLDEFERELAGSLIDLKKIYLEIDSLTLQQPVTKPLYYAEQIRLRNPSISFEPLKKVAATLRMKKDEWEIEQLKKAIDVTAAGLNRVFKETRAGMYEYQLEAMMSYELMNHGLKNWGFKPIIATGKNAVTLHYCRNDCKIARNDLVLVDVGALNNNYSADITRTFPVAARFTKRQKEVYTEVLKVQECIINMIEPGITLKELSSKTVELLTEAMFRLKLIEKKEEYRKYYMHGVSHFLGMAAHDISVYYGESILEPGNVITVEPGLYIEEEGIGVRIEDDVLVTENGAELLSPQIPKQVEELEAIRKRALEKK